MKNCLICLAPVHPSAETCPGCGESSFSVPAGEPEAADTPATPEAEPEPIARVPTRPPARRR